MEKRKRGRPSKYEKINPVELIKKLALYGLTDEQAADVLGSSRSTLNKFKDEHKEEFSDTIKRNKEIADNEIVSSMRARAKGFTGPDGKFYPPDTTAGIFWLKNRQPEHWRDRRDIGIGFDKDNIQSHFDKLAALMVIRDGINEEQTEIKPEENETTDDPSQPDADSTEIL